jgi:hypothetical protein
VTRLAEIIEASTRDDVSVASLRRRVKVVAARIGTVELDAWVTHELGGYPDDATLPPYRGPFVTEVIGHFSGPFGSEAKVQIPSMSVPAQLRDGLAFHVAFRQPIMELEDLSKSSSNFQLQSPWPANIVGWLNRQMRDGEVTLMPMHGLVAAHRVVTSAQIRGVVDNVKTRVLNLALDLERIAPDAGETNSPTPDPVAVTTIVQNNIYGGTTNLAVGGIGVSQQATVVHPGDLESLLLAAAEAGLSEADVRDLRDAVTRDQADSDELLTEPGPGVRDFLGRQVLRMGGVAEKVGIGASGGIVAALVRAYFRLP